MTDCPHPERQNVLSLPSLGNPHCCLECFDTRMANFTPYKGKREAWEQGSDYTKSAGATFCDTTRGRIQLTDYEPGGKFK